MFLLAGIGNIGKKYTFTRHNIGFLIIDAIIKEYDCKKEKIVLKVIFIKDLFLKIE